MDTVAPVRMGLRDPACGILPGPPWQFVRDTNSPLLHLDAEIANEPLCIVLFEACSAFTRVTACTLALSPYIVTRYPKASATSLPP
jgi:hypothetical protein